MMWLSLFKSLTVSVFFLFCLTWRSFSFGQNSLQNTNWSLQETNEFPYENIVSSTEIDYQNPQADFSGILHDEVIEPEIDWWGEWYFKWFLTFLSIQRFITDTTNWQSNEDKSAVSYITYLLNLGIALSAFIALLFIIYWFFGMLFTKDGDGFTKAKKIVINSAIAIGIIGVSRFVVMMAFYTYTQVSDINRPDRVMQNK